MRRILPMVLLAVCLTMGVAGGANRVRVRLNEVTRSVFYAPQYVALNLGFFAREGLEIELTTGQGADRVMTAVLSGQADIGFCGPEACIYVYNQGRANHGVIFAQLTKRDGSFLMGRKPEPDFDWGNLRGKTIIGGRKGGVPVMTLEYVLRRKGLIPGKDVHIDTSVQFAMMAGAFLGGLGDYVTIFEPTASMLEREKRAFIVASIGRESGEIPYTAYFAGKNYISRNRDVIQRFTNAIYRGQQWVAGHTPREIAKAIAPSFPDADEELLTMVAERYKSQDAWCTDPILRKPSLDLLQHVMRLAGELDREASYEAIVETDFAAKAMAGLK